eukprot:s1391_g5.t1
MRCVSLEGHQRPPRRLPAHQMRASRDELRVLSGLEAETCLCFCGEVVTIGGSSSHDLETHGLPQEGQAHGGPSWGDHLVVMHRQGLRVVGSRGAPRCQGDGWAHRGDHQDVLCLQGRLLQARLEDQARSCRPADQGVPHEGLFWLVQSFEICAGHATASPRSWRHTAAGAKRQALKTAGSS